MGVFFGTDGIRGKTDDELSFSTAYKCGMSLGRIQKKSNILIGRDTRGSGDYLALAFSCGAIYAGANIVYVGVCPTAGISFLTQNLGFDFGVIISASHNSFEFNGIKILNRFGEKISEKIESQIEHNFLKNFCDDGFGTFCYRPKFIENYKQFLIQNTNYPLHGKTIVLDTANGAGFKIAPWAFKKLGARVVSINSYPTGENINLKCGAVDTFSLQKKVKALGADMGFAFDGDSDRVIAVDENGMIVDGDEIIYILSKFYLQNKLLKNPCVVGTKLTNLGIELAFEKIGLKLFRSDIGDKFVHEKMLETGAVVGGEQSGHIIMADKLKTGDGILTALTLAKICCVTGKKLSGFKDYKLFKQCSFNVKVKNKNTILDNKNLKDFIEKTEGDLKNLGRVLIRPSGTEPCIRIMVESNDEGLSQSVATSIMNLVKKIDLES